MVRGGRVQALDTAGSDLADKAADFGRRRLLAGIIGAGRLCTAACREWYPIVFDLHRFFIAIARAVVDEDGHNGSAPHPIVWDRGVKPERRRVLQAVTEFAWVPGPPDLWRHGSVGSLCLSVGAADVAAWPYSVGMLVKLCVFLGSLPWPASVDDLGPSGVSYVEMLILNERWARERLDLELAVPRSGKGGRLISVEHRHLPFL